MSFSLNTDSEAFLIKQLYKAFHLKDSVDYFKCTQDLQKNLFERGQITEATYQECIERKRRTGKTTNLIISAIASWLQGEYIVFRAPSYNTLEVIKDKLEKFMPGIRNDYKKVIFLVGTKSGTELHGLPSNAFVFDDEPELFKNQ